MVKIQNVVCAFCTGFALAGQVWYAKTPEDWELRNLPDVLEDGKIKPEFECQYLAHVGWAQGIMHFVWGIISVGLVTMIYNSMLLVAAQMSNPFNQDVLSFPGLYYEKGVMDDANFFFNMGKGRAWDPSIFQRPRARSVESVQEDSPPQEQQSLAQLMERMSARGGAGMPGDTIETKKSQ